MLRSLTHFVRVPEAVNAEEILAVDTIQIRSHNLAFTAHILLDENGRVVHSVAC